MEAVAGGWTRVALQPDSGMLSYAPTSSALGAAHLESSPMAFGAAAGDLAAAGVRIVASGTVGDNVATVDVSVSLGSATSKITLAEALDASSAHLTPTHLVLGDATTLSLCDAAEVQAVWCAALCGLGNGALAAVCNADARNLTFSGGASSSAAVCASIARTSVAVESASCAGQTQLTQLSSVALYVRGTAVGTDAAPVTTGEQLAATPQAGTPWCGSDVPVGQSAGMAAQSCAHVWAGYTTCSDGLYTPPNGMYWIRAAGLAARDAALTYCLMAPGDGMDGVGTGWTAVAAQGESPTATATVPGQLAQVDVRGQAFDEVLLLRGGPLWCDGAAVATGSPSATHATGTGFGVGLSATDGIAYAFNASGTLVKVATSATGTGWAVDEAAEAEDDAVQVSPVGADGAALVWQLIDSPTAASRPLAVGSLLPCTNTGAAVRVFVRDSSAMAEAAAAAQAAAAAGVNAATGGFVVDGTVLVDVNATVAQASSECFDYTLTPATGAAAASAVFEALGTQPFEPVSLQEEAARQCSQPVTAITDAAHRLGVPVTTVTQVEAAEAATTLHAGARDCGDVLAMGSGTSGWYSVYPDGVVAGGRAVQVYCDMDTAGGGWTVAYANEVGEAAAYAYAAGTAALVKQSAEVLLAFRDAELRETSAVLDDDAGVANWVVLPTPQAWRLEHPALANASDVDTTTFVAGDASPVLRRLRFGRASAVAGACDAPWVAGAPANSVAGRVCVEGSTGVFWAGFASATTGQSATCTRSTALLTAGTPAAPCSRSQRRFSIAVRRGTGSDASPIAANALTAAAPASRLGVQTASDTVGPAEGSQLWSEQEATALDVYLGLPTSCADAVRRNPEAVDGWYTVQAPVFAMSGATAAPTPTRVYCDMTNGGWQRCAKLPASGYHGMAPLLTAWRGEDDTDSPDWAWSDDCRWALRAGTLIAITDSESGVDASTTGSAVLTAPNDGDATVHVDWQAEGRAVGMTVVGGATARIARFVVSQAGLGEQCAGGSTGATERSRGPLLQTQDRQSSSLNSCAVVGTYAGVHGCAG